MLPLSIHLLKTKATQKRLIEVALSVLILNIAIYIMQQRLDKSSEKRKNCN